MIHNQEMYQNAECTRQQLKHFKEYCKEEIDSKRIYDTIQSIKDLKIILLKRDCMLKLEYVLNNLTVHRNEEPIRNPPPLLEYNRNIRQLPVLPALPVDPIQQVDEIIAEEIGQKWKTLARALGIVEGKIDDFAATHPRRIGESVREILRYHRTRSPRNWKIELCNGLDIARRRDLRFQIQNILNDHGLM